MEESALKSSSKRLLIQQIVKLVEIALIRRSV